MLHNCPDGIRFTELVDALHRIHPERTVKAIGNDIVGLDRTLPTQVYKPSKGLYMHCRFAPEGMTDTSLMRPKAASRRGSGHALQKEYFYSLVANWLKDDSE